MFSFLKLIARTHAPAVGLVVALVLLLSACSAATSAAPTPTAPLKSQVCGPDCNPPDPTQRPSPTPKPPTPTPTATLAPTATPVPATPLPQPPVLAAFPTTMSVSQSGPCHVGPLPSGQAGYICSVTLHGSTNGPFFLAWQVNQISPPGVAQVSPSTGFLSDTSPNGTLTINVDSNLFQSYPLITITITSQTNSVTIAISH